MLRYAAASYIWYSLDLSNKKAITTSGMEALHLVLKQILTVCTLNINRNDFIDNLLLYYNSFNNQYEGSKIPTFLATSPFLPP